jgi:hypothetical protein
MIKAKKINMNLKHLCHEVDYKLWVMKTRLRAFIWKARHHIRNPRKEMRKAVFPSQWWDLQAHIIEFHIQCIIEYVEREKCFEVISWSWNDEATKKGKELQEAYDYAKTGRAKLQKDIEAAWDKIPLRDLYPAEDPLRDIKKPRTIEEQLELYSEVNTKEAWLWECDTKFCKWVIDNRGILWT